MSQSFKLSLWQRIKQLLSVSAEPTAIDDTKIDNDLDLDSDLSSDSSLTKPDKNNAYSLKSEDDSNRDDCIESCLKDPKGNNNENTDVSGSSADLNPHLNHNVHRIVVSHVDNHFDEVIYSSLSSNLDSRLESCTDTDTDTDAYFDNDIDSMAKQDALNDTPIVNYLKQYFDEQHWHYTHYRPKSSSIDNNNNDSQQSHYLSFRMRNKNLDCGYLFRVQEHNNLLAVYGILPFLIPESHQSAAMLLITQINYDMLIGNLEMDVSDGEIRYKNAIDVEAVGMDDTTIEHLLQSVLAMTTVTYEIFSELVNNQNPAVELQELLMALHRQEDARTFFLPTQFVQ